MKYHLRLKIHQNAICERWRFFILPVPTERLVRTAQRRCSPANAMGILPTSCKLHVGCLCSLRDYPSAVSAEQTTHEKTTKLYCPSRVSPAGSRGFGNFKRYPQHLATTAGDNMTTVTTSPAAKLVQLPPFGAAKLEDLPCRLFARHNAFSRR